MTLLAWLAAYLIVTALLLVAGPWLESLPMAMRASLISGVLVTAMTNLVMPVLGHATWHLYRKAVPRPG